LPTKMDDRKEEEGRSDGGECANSASARVEVPPGTSGHRMHSYRCPEVDLAQNKDLKNNDTHFAFYSTVVHGRKRCPLLKLRTDHERTAKFG